MRRPQEVVLAFCDQAISPSARYATGNARHVKQAIGDSHDDRIHELINGQMVRWSIGTFLAPVATTLTNYAEELRGADEKSSE